MRLNSGMKSGFGLILCLSIFLAPNVQALAPKLYEVVLEGVSDEPEIVLSDSPLEINQEYLFMIENKFSSSYILHLEKFGQHVSTQYLQGSPSVTQESLYLLPSSKVIWHFTVNSPGSFEIYAVDSQSGKKSKTMQLKILGDNKESQEIVKKENPLSNINHHLR